LDTLAPLPERNLPSFIAFISRSTDADDAGLYFRPPVAFFDGSFFAADFFAAAFFVAILRTSLF
jgi:hypothetical protein